MSRLPTYGVLQYGTIVFPVETEVVSISSTPVPDEAKRTIKKVRHTLSVKTTIGGQTLGGAATSTDSALAAIRAQLTKNGLPLIVTGRGFGFLQINTGRLQQQDLMYGPWPELLSFKPLARDMAAEIEWKVTVEIADCAYARSVGVMDWSYSLAFSVDKAGYSSRRYDYTLEVPNYRWGGDRRSILDSPDNYVDQILPAPIPGFGREWGERRIDKAKNRVEGSVTDSEMSADVPPPYCAEWSADHVTSSDAAGLTKWVGVVSGRYLLARNAPARWIPAQHFFNQLVADRVGEVTRQLSQPGSGPNVGFQSGAATVIPVRIAMREPGIGTPQRRYEFTFAYTFVCSLSNILAASGMWRPVPGSNWREWAASLEQSAFSPRGGAQLVFSAGDDRVIDLCDPVGVSSISRRQKNPGQETELRNNRIPDASELTDVKADTSWLTYLNSFKVMTDDGVSILRTLPDTELRAGRDDGLGSPKGTANLGSQNPIPLGGPGDTTFNALQPQGWNKVFPRGAGGGQEVVKVPKAKDKAEADANKPQRRVKPAYYILMIGNAARVGFPVPVPAIVSVGKTVPVPCNDPKKGDGFQQGITANWGAPVYAAQWQLRYYVPPGVDNDQGIALPPNPLMGGA